MDQQAYLVEYTMLMQNWFNYGVWTWSDSQVQWWNRRIVDCMLDCLREGIPLSEVFAISDRILQSQISSGE